MKKIIMLILIPAMLLGCCTAFAAEGGDPALINGSPELPEPGSAANGSVLLDYEIAKITVLRCRYLTDSPIYEIDLLVENRTDDIMHIASMYAIVDGFYFEAYAECDLAPGALAETTVSILAEDFAYLGILTPQEIKFNITFMSSDSYDFIDIAYLAIYPAGLAPEMVCYTNADEIGYPFYRYENELTGCSFRILDARPIQDGEFYRLDLLLENSSDRHKVLSLKDFKVNGVETDPYWLEGLPGGSMMLSYVFVDMAELGEKGVSEIDDIEFCFTIDDEQRTLLSQWMRIEPPKG